MTKTIQARQAAHTTRTAGTSALDRDTTALMRDMATVLMLTRRVANDIYADVPAPALRSARSSVAVG